MISNTTVTNCLSGALPVRLSEHLVCNPGFYCPNNSAAHPPEYCPPTSSCQSIRLQAQQNVCPEAQGIFEPSICPPGHYCPKGGKEILECSPGHFCPLGTMDQVRCSATSICPSGSVREFSLLGFILVIVIDLVLGVCSWWMSFKLEKKAAKSRCADVESSQLLSESHDAQVLSHAYNSSENTAVCSSNSGIQEYVLSASRCVGSNSIGMSFGYSDLSYTVPGTGLEILSSMSGEVSKGRLCAVMGASGAGKSTFVDILIGRKRPATGAIFVNGRKPKTTSKLIGYVPQEDTLLPELTVRETIYHSARIRLPRSWSNYDCCKHVNLILQCLGLEHVQHNVVGDISKCGLSGGERKRLSIGVELAAAPMALFLDEPTSGLDAASAMHVVNLLRQLSRSGFTVILVIHQPRKEIFESIDDVILLDKGRQAYTGKRSGLIAYFESYGHKFPDGSNPADVIMDILSAGFSCNTIAPQKELHEYNQHEADAQGLDCCYEKDAVKEDDLLVDVRIRAHWVHQVWLCLFRSLKQQQRRISSFYLEIVVGGIAGLIIGLSLYSFRGLHFQGIYRSPFERLSSSVSNNTVGMIALMVCMAIGLTGAPPGVRTFGEEKMLYRKEANSGHSLSAYYTGKVLSTFPRIAISALHFTSYYTILATPVLSFWDSFMIAMLYFYAIYGLASIVSVSVSRQDGPLVAVIVCLVVSVLGGYGPSLKTVEEWHLDWFWRMCPGTWVSEAYIDRTLRRVGYLYNVQAAAETFGFVLGRYGLDLSMIFVLGTSYRILAFFLLVIPELYMMRRT